MYKCTMDKSEALKLASENVTDKILLNHMLAVSAIMEGIAKYLNADSEKWAITGLLHDIDFEKTSKGQKSLLAIKHLFSYLFNSLIFTAMVSQ